MDAFYFGPSTSYLFGCYHPPRNKNRREGIVLCNPFGQEYMRAHRSLRRLALNLVEQGYAVLRFDYRGTGDSAGTIDNVSAEDWQEDIRYAVQELIDIAAVPKVSLIGLRVGALLAANVAANNPLVSRLLLWDPIISGEQYVSEMVGEIQQAPTQRSRAKFVSPEGDLHFNGFMMPRTFQAALKTMDLKTLSGLDNTAVAQIVSHETSDFAELKSALGILPKFYYELAPAPHDWNYVDHVGGIMWPQPIVQAIENYFSQ